MNAELLWSMFIKSSIVISVAFLASVILRRSSASRRHVVWLACVLALLLLPLAELRLPNWNVSVERTPIVAPLLAPIPLRVVPDVGTIPNRPIVVLNSVPSTEKQPIDPAAIALRLWGIGIFALVLWVGLGLIRAWQLVKSSVRWQTPFLTGDSLLCQYKVLVSKSLKVPATVGVIRPVVLLPREAQTWDESRLRMVVGHEVAHITRRDWLWQILSQATCIAYFFNPLVWIAARQLRKESEFASDDFVLGLGIEPTSYAQELLTIARQAKFQFAGTVGMAKTTNVESRLRSIIDLGRRRNRASGAAILGSLALMAALVLPVALLHAMPSISRQTLQALQSKKHLPHIKWIASKEIEPNVYLAKGGIAGLPNGFSIRLVGIGSNEQSLNWGLDGKPLADAEDWRQGGPWWQGNVFHRWSHGTMPGSFSRSFIVEVEADSDSETSTTSHLISPGPINEMQRLNPNFAGGDDRIPKVAFKSKDPAYAIIDLNVAQRVEKGVYRFGVADPTWHTEVEFPNPFTGTPGGVGKELGVGGSHKPDACGISLQERPVIYYTDEDQKYHQAYLLGDTVLNPNTAVRVVLYDRKGELIEQPEIPMFSNGGHPLIMMPATLFSQIAKVVVQTSTYRWAEFRDIPLRPNLEKEEAARLDSGIKGTAVGIAPGFVKKLKNGVTVAISSVTKATLDGDNWRFKGQPSWRADGQILAKGPEIYDFARPASVWGKQPLIDIHIDYEGLSHEANTTVQAIGQYDPKFWLAGEAPVSRTGSSALVTAYLPVAVTGGVRVGVASGPWVTVATKTIDLPELPPVVGGANTTTTGFGMMLDSIPMFGFADDKKPTNLVAQPLANVAMRFVAILKSGGQQVLIPGGHGMHGVEVYQIPARHGERTESYNHIIANDIKEIQLQTRPFEYVEFNGIELNHK